MNWFFRELLKYFFECFCLRNNLVAAAEFKVCKKAVECSFDSRIENRRRVVHFKQVLFLADEK